MKKCNEEVCTAVRHFTDYAAGNYIVRNEDGIATVRMFGNKVFTRSERGGKWTADNCGWCSNSTVRCLNACLEGADSSLRVKVVDDDMVLMEGRELICSHLGTFDSTYEYMTATGAEVKRGMWRGETRYEVWRKFTTRDGKSRKLLWKHYGERRNADKAAAHFNAIADLNAKEV